MKIEYDEYYKCWVVWDKNGDGFFEKFRGAKKDCKNYVKKSEKRKKRLKNEQQETNWI